MFLSLKNPPPLCTNVSSPVSKNDWNRRLTDLSSAIIVLKVLRKRLKHKNSTVTLTYTTVSTTDSSMCHSRLHVIIKHADRIIVVIVNTHFGKLGERRSDIILSHVVSVYYAFAPPRRLSLEYYIIYVYKYTCIINGIPRRTISNNERGL